MEQGGNQWAKGVHRIPGLPRERHSEQTRVAIVAIFIHTKPGENTSESGEKKKLKDSGFFRKKNQNLFLLN